MLSSNRLKTFNISSVMQQPPSTECFDWSRAITWDIFCYLCLVAFHLTIVVHWTLSCDWLCTSIQGSFFCLHSGHICGKSILCMFSLNAMYRLTISPVRTDVMVRKFLEIVYDARAGNQLVTFVTLSKPHRSVTVRKTSRKYEFPNRNTRAVFWQRHTRY